MQDDLAGLIGRVQLSSCAICHDAYTALETLTRERDEARAEVVKCHENIRLKADFIDVTINDCAAKDETIDTLRAQLTATQARLEEALGEIRKLKPYSKEEVHLLQRALDRGWPMPSNQPNKDEMLALASAFLAQQEGQSNG